MTAEPAHLQHDDNVVELNDGPGRRLRLARQARGLEIRGIAAELHLKPSIISALEHDRYDELPGTVFVTGYMRKYAHLVGIDPEPVLDAYRALNPRAEPSRYPTPRKPPEQVGSGHFAVRLTSFIIFAALAVLAAVWWQTQSPIGEPAVEPLPAQGDSDAGEYDPAPIQMPEQTEPSPPAPEPAANETSRETVVVESSKPDPSTEPGEPKPPEQTAVLAEPDPPESKPVEEEPPQVEAAAEDDRPDAAEEPANGEVVMEFSGPCWVDIRDSERKFKLFGEMGNGDRHRLEGKPPYSVIIGNAAAVQITVAGEPFDLASIARGNVARFTLDPTKLP
jgi:cytoskeleton protein RodZ